MPGLLRDFDRRCAYCMQREAEAEGFKIDHHFPTSRGGPWTDYTNLFLSCDRCNHHKHDWWPSPEDQRAGARFLNCCHEIDYGEQLFEDENGVIIPRGPAATYHRRMLKLNRPDLVRLRIARRRLNDEIEHNFCQIETEFDDQSKKLLLMRIDYLKLLLEDLIPKIPSPPPTLY